MSSNNASERTVSDVQSTTTEERGHEPTVEHEPSGRSACPECESQVITEDEQSFCTDCGLIVADEWVDLSPTLNDLGLVGDADQSIETVDPLRTDKGLHTKIGRNTDGHGNPLSNEQWEKVQRLRKWHKRMQFGEKRKRTKRLNEGLRDVEMIGGNLSLPDHVVKMAAQFLRSASEARLPGGRMAGGHSPAAPSSWPRGPPRSTGTTSTSRSRRTPKRPTSGCALRRGRSGVSAGSTRHSSGPTP